jgi:hypothetical protein
MKKHLIGSAVFVGKKFEFSGIRAQVKELHIGGRVQFGIVTENTKVIYRSESARYFIFIQMSKEMWEFDEDGDLYYEKAVHGFLPELFANWSLLGVTHIASIALCTRVLFDDVDEEALQKHPSLSVDQRQTLSLPLPLPLSSHFIHFGNLERDITRTFTSSWWMVRLELNGNQSSPS